MTKEELIEEVKALQESLHTQSIACGERANESATEVSERFYRGATSAYFHAAAQIEGLLQKAVAEELGGLPSGS